MNDAISTASCRQLDMHSTCPVAPFQSDGISNLTDAKEFTDKDSALVPKSLQGYMLHFTGAQQLVTSSKFLSLSSKDYRASYLPIVDTKAT